jgi:hypothetical protein
MINALKIKSGNRWVIIAASDPEFMDGPVQEIVDGFTRDIRVYRGSDYLSVHQGKGFNPPSLDVESIRIEEEPRFKNAS